ncbi:MAG: hypothetical protein M1835_007387 [Candelina submexicana]|nr:MAG: hypothetical protein M1835_007387 [Candelina submexicana]
MHSTPQPALLKPLLPFLRSFHTTTKPRLAIWYENRLGMMYGLRKGLAPLRFLPAGRALIEEVDEEIEFLKKGLRHHGVDVEELEEKKKIKGKGKKGGVVENIGDGDSLVGNVEGGNATGGDTEVGVEGVMAGVRGSSLAEGIVDDDVQREWNENWERGEEEQRGRAPSMDNDFVYDRPKGRATGKERKPPTAGSGKRDAETKDLQEPKFSYRKGMVAYVAEVVAWEIEMRKREGRLVEDADGKLKSVENRDISGTNGKLKKGKRAPDLLDLLFGKSIMGKVGEREPPRERSRERSKYGGSPNHGEPSRQNVPSRGSGSSRRSVPSRHGTNSTRGEPSRLGQPSEHGESSRNNEPSRHSEHSRHSVQSTRGQASTQGEPSRHGASSSQAAPSRHSERSRHDHSSTHREPSTHVQSSRHSVTLSHGAPSRRSAPSRHGDQHSRAAPSAHDNDTILPTDSISQRPSTTSHHTGSHTEPPVNAPAPQPAPELDGHHTATDSGSASSSSSDDDHEGEPARPNSHQTLTHSNPSNRAPPDAAASSAHSSISHLSSYQGTTTNALNTSSTARSSTRTPSPLIPSIPPPSYTSNRSPTANRSRNSRRSSTSRNAGPPPVNGPPVPSGAPPTYASDHYRTRYQREYGGEGENGRGEGSGRGRARLPTVSERSGTGSSMRGPPIEERG